MSVTAVAPLSVTVHHETYPAIDPRQPRLSAAGKSVIVTGAGGTIGAAIVESFAQAGAANVAILGRTVSTLEKTASHIHGSYPQTHVRCFTFDLASADFRSSQSFVESALHELKIKQFDALVLNAAYIQEQSSLSSSDFSSDEFWKCFEINVRGNISLTRAFIQHAPANATIVNVTSFLSYLPAFPYRVVGYPASKAAFEKVMEYLHAEKPELRVFNLHPGAIKSDMMAKSGVDMNSEDIIYDDPKLAGDFCVWLASIEADFLNGRTLEATWDVQEMETAKSRFEADSRLFKVGLEGRGYVPLRKSEEGS